jgi:hypothetical protein
MAQMFAKLRIKVAIVHLDMSTQSIAVAKARVLARGLARQVEFVQVDVVFACWWVLAHCLW